MDPPRAWLSHAAKVVEPWEKIFEKGQNTVQEVSSEEKGKKSV